MLKTQLMDYKDGEVGLEGYYAYDSSLATKRPAVLVAHDWSGMNEFARQQADKLATLGYVGFALDMFGKGVHGESKEEKSALIAPLLADRTLLRQRVLAALEAVRKIDMVATSRIGAIGFCFGGLTVLDLARSGADVKGVVSIHGLLNAPPQTTGATIKASVLVLHGYDDPMVKPDEIDTFAAEMNAAEADWQLDIYGHTMHGFTNPKANDPDFGTVYNPRATERAWAAVQQFLTEIFSGKEGKDG